MRFSSLPIFPSISFPASTQPGHCCLHYDFAPFQRKYPPSLTPQVNEPQDCPFSLRPSLVFSRSLYLSASRVIFFPPLVGLSVFLSSCCCCQDAVRVVLDTGIITLNTPPQPNTHTMICPCCTELYKLHQPFFDGLLCGVVD